MKTQHLPRLLMSLFFLAGLGLIFWVNLERPSVLVLHSYSTDYVWTRGINEGLQRVLSSRHDLRVRYHYMKTKQFSDPEALRRAGLVARRVLEQYEPDIVIAVDDYAQKLVVRHYVDRKDLSIVFAGINNSHAAYGYDKARNVTGILERIPVRGLAEALVEIGAANGGGTDASPRVLFLADPSLTGQHNAEYLAAADWGAVRYQGVRAAPDYQAWQQTVLELKGKTDFLLISGYRKLPRSTTDAGYVPPAEIIGWTERHSPVPVVGMNVFNSEDGAMFSLGVSPYEQGEVAAEMALALLDKGGDASGIPVRTSQQFLVAVRASAAARRGYRIPPLYEAFARATNNYFP